jgi:ABC-type branched-subunit amino acid transport system substrate-binding protein
MTVWKYIVVLMFIVLAGATVAHAETVTSEPRTGTAESSDQGDGLEAGRRMYMDGVLPSGGMMTATIKGDINVTGDQVICGSCHRRSGMGASEGQEVVPAVTGPLLFNPLRLPTSKPPLAPLQRPAYTDETLKRAIRDGIGADGNELGPYMPRYPLADEDLEILVSYLRDLSTDPSPGVTDTDMHFATIVADSVDTGTRKALLDVMQVFFKQKNTETRHESKRAANAPWHKENVFKPYRKWVLHVWELTGPSDTWAAQLEAHYQKQPVFAVLSGVAPGSWRPMHEFCEQNQVPCLFPTTDLPVIDEQDFYSVYFSRGMTLEAEAIVQHLTDDRLILKPVVQVYRGGDPLGETAAKALQGSLAEQGGRVRDFRLTDGDIAADVFWQAVLDEGGGGAIVLWLGGEDLQAFWNALDATGGPERIYLSTSLYNAESAVVSAKARDLVYFVHSSELPGKLRRLLMRSTGWLRAKRIYAPEEQRVQANAFFALKMAGEAVRMIKSYFYREYFLERIEHMVDNAIYTSVYPRISLAPGQRFVSKGCYIAMLQEEGRGGLTAVTDWLIPGFD